MSQPERRHHRSVNTTRALCYQLDAALHQGQLSAMVLADEEGVCLATAGDSHACNEIAAHLPLMGHKVNEFEGVLYGPEVHWDIKMRRFEVDDTELYLCAIGDSDCRSEQFERSLDGVGRILQP